MGQCGEKNCQSATGGLQTVGCKSRHDDTARALAFSDDTSFGCRLDALSSGQPAGFYNVTLHQVTSHRGDAYKGDLSRQIDYATGDMFDAELLPRVFSVEPRSGSLAGGATVTIYGSGFGSTADLLHVTVAGASCNVTDLTPAYLRCAVQPMAPNASISAAYPSERGFNWARPGESVDPMDLLVTEGGFAAPYALSNTSFLEGYFEPPLSCEYSFMIHQHSHAELYWSSDDRPEALERLAKVILRKNHWPTYPEDRFDGAISRRVSLVAGRRYWLRLSCAGVGYYERKFTKVGRCALGARMHSSVVPAPLALPSRILTRRTVPPKVAGRSVDCTSIIDKAQCCASLDATTKASCIPAVSVFSTPATNPDGSPVYPSRSATCATAAWAAQHGSSSQASCPPRENVTHAVPRAKLPSRVACSTITDRTVCSESIDGRLMGVYMNQACIPASTIFQNGNTCESAVYVMSFDPLAAASGAEFVSPMTPYRGLAQEVQRITLQQAAPVKLAYVVRLTAIECPTSTDCITAQTAGVQFIHAGKLSTSISLGATGASISAAFATIADSTLSGLTASVTSRSNTELVWRLELDTPWSACTRQLQLPLLAVRAAAKVTATVERDTLATCFSGEIELRQLNESFTTGAAPSGRAAFLKWDATETEAASAVASLLSGGGSVQVQRSGDGHGVVKFDIIYWGIGNFPLLTADDSGLAANGSAVY